MLQPNVPAWFEIPALDLDRAVRFYETVLAARLAREQMGPMAMAVFPYEKPGSSGALVKADGFVPAVTGRAFWGGVWTLGAWCRLRQAFRNFRVDRIVDQHATGESFPDDPARGLAAYFAEMGVDADSVV